MDKTDASIVWLLKQEGSARRRSALGSLGTNGKGGGSSSQDSRGMAQDITRSVAQMTAGITQAVIASRAARRQPPAVATLGPETIGGEAYGVSATTPWGKIAIGGTAVVIIGGLIIYIASRPKAKAAA